MRVDPRRFEVTIEIGEMPIRVRTRGEAFARMLEERYAGFLSSSLNRPGLEFEVELAPPGDIGRSEDVRVSREAGRWRLERGDFEAEWDLALRRGWIRQPANPYSLDAVLRIVHTLLLAPAGGFLLHAASAIRNGRAFLFTGISGAGKTTIARLAPPEARLLTDEISYVRPQGHTYVGFGTPFTGELERPGENVSAPVAGLYLLSKGAGNRAAAVAAADAVRALMRNILFFAEDGELTGQVFQSACAFAARVPVQRLEFRPDPGVWELIR